MKKMIVVGLIGLALVLTAFGTSILLNPQPSQGTNGTDLLQTVEVVWDGGIWNGRYEAEIFNPTDRIIEGSVYVFAEDTDEKWGFIGCGSTGRFVLSDVPLIQVFYPNETTKVYTHYTDFLYADNLKVVVVSGDRYILEETTTVREWIQLEVVDVKWGEMVNRSYEAPTARWINFTLISHVEGESVPMFTLNPCDKRGWHLQHGLNEIMMMGDTSITEYQLYFDDRLAWEGIVEEG